MDAGDVRVAWPAGGLILMVGIWYLWSNQGSTHNAENAATAAFSPDNYHAYSWWRGHGHTVPYHHCYPERLMMNTAPATLQESEGTLSVARSVAGNG